MDPSTTPAATPSQFAPTSPSAVPSLPLTTRQLRPHKSPMFVPAALRPTERAPRSSPLTPPRSVHGSTDSLDASDPRPLSRRSTDKSKQKSTTLAQVTETGSPSPFEDAANTTLPTADLPSVTGPPTRAHWKADAAVSICDAPVCAKLFGLFERRHHCRHCGNVFCGEHSTWTVPLDQDANFHPQALQFRACGHCWSEYGRYVEEQATGGAAEGSSGGQDGGGIKRTQSRPIGLPAQQQQQQQQGDKRGSLAQSLTGTWNWSTF
ncbi:hypothetical protein MMC21_004972 [Puttea exsequens]|nr:hypothetical protein [Puttea exsequens]